MINNFSLCSASKCYAPYHTVRSLTSVPSGTGLIKTPTRANNFHHYIKNERPFSCFMNKKTAR